MWHAIHFGCMMLLSWYIINLTWSPYVNFVTRYDHNYSTATYFLLPHSSVFESGTMFQSLTSLPEEILEEILRILDHRTLLRTCSV
jgi:hypothetical protein